MKKTPCKIILLDEVNCIFVGLHPDHIIYFYEKYGIFAKGYFFNPKFQLGSWDGKIRFFYKDGKTYVNMLADIVPRVIGLGYEISMEDRRTAVSVVPELIDEDFFSHIIDEETGNSWKIRDYQVDSVNSLLINSGGLVIAGTGAGKTSICAALALSYEHAANFRSIIIVPDTTLTDQTKEEYEYFGLDVGEYSGKTKDLDHQHVVATWQTLKNNPMVLLQFNMVIVDEAQNLRGPILKDLLINHGKKIAFRFGCTGTLPDEPSDAQSVKIAVGDVQYEVPAHQLIKDGHLSTIEIDIIQMEVNLTQEYEQFSQDTRDDPDIPNWTYSQFKDRYFPDYNSEKSFLQTEKSRIAWIANYLESFRLTGRGNCMCLVNSVVFGKKLAKAIPGAVFLHGKDKSAIRKEIYESFKDNDDLIAIATVHIAGTGLNIKRIFNLFIIDLGKSFIRTIQSLGRGLRKAHDKDHVYVGDICSDLKYSKAHLTKRIQFYTEAQYPHKKRTVDY